MNGINKALFLIVISLLACREDSPKANSRFYFVNSSQSTIKIEFNGNEVTLIPLESYKYYETRGMITEALFTFPPSLNSLKITRTDGLVFFEECGLQTNDREIGCDLISWSIFSPQNHKSETRKVKIGFRDRRTYEIPDYYFDFKQEFFEDFE